MKVLVTGGGGYIGTALCPMLVERGYDVTVLDRFFFGKEMLDELDGRIKLIRDDTRWYDPAILSGMDAVMDLAALSNDPTGELNQELTMNINYKSRARTAKLAKKAGVSRYILASSVSVYGFKDEVVDEKSDVNPLTTYAKANYLVESDILPLAGNGFYPSALRQSSVYGYARRMRFDISLNSMVLNKFQGKNIQLMRDGNQKRPIIHVKDTARAFIDVMEADPEKVSGEVFNVGANDQNFKLYDLVKLVSDTLNVPMEFDWYGFPDYRSYTVSFDKISKQLGYKVEHPPKEGVKEVYGRLQDGTIKPDIKTITLEWYKYLIKTKETMDNILINGKLF